MTDFLELLDEIYDTKTLERYKFVDELQYSGEEVLVCVLLDRENGDGYVDVCYNIPEYPDKECTVICVDYDVWLNKSLYKFVVGHELAHMDIGYLAMDEPKHRFHCRNILMEIYCDVKSLESTNDVGILNDILSEITNWTSLYDNHRKNYDVMREFELRKWFIRKLKQGKKITSKFLYEYINKRIPEINIEIYNNLKEAEKFLDVVKDMKNSKAVNTIYINKKDRFYV